MNELRRRPNLRAPRSLFWHTAAVCAAVTMASPTESLAQSDLGDRVVTFLAGAAGSFIIGSTVYLLLDRHVDDREVVGDAGFSPTANWGLLLSSPVGAATAVHFVRRRRSLNSSFPGALVGSTITTLPFVLGRRDPYLPYYFLTLGSAMQGAGALFGAARLSQSLHRTSH